MAIDERDKDLPASQVDEDEDDGLYDPFAMAQDDLQDSSPFPVMGASDSQAKDSEPVDDAGDDWNFYQPAEAAGTDDEPGAPDTLWDSPAAPEEAPASWAASPTADEASAEDAGLPDFSRASEPDEYAATTYASDEPDYPVANPFGPDDDFAPATATNALPEVDDWGNPAEPEPDPIPAPAAYDDPDEEDPLAGYLHDTPAARPEDSEDTAFPAAPDLAPASPLDLSHAAPATMATPQKKKLPLLMIAGGTAAVLALGVGGMLFLGGKPAPAPVAPLKPQAVELPKPPSLPAPLTATETPPAMSDAEPAPENALAKPAREPRAATTNPVPAETPVIETPAPSRAKVAKPYRTRPHYQARKPRPKAYTPKASAPVTPEKPAPQPEAAPPKAIVTPAAPVVTPAAPITRHTVPDGYEAIF